MRTLFTHRSALLPIQRSTVTMTLKYRILSFHHIPNHGAFLFAYSLLKTLQAEYAPADVKILDHRSPRLAVYESLKRFKIIQSIPFFYSKRMKLWKQIIKQHLDLDSDYPRLMSQKQLLQYCGAHYDALIVGMDAWCLIKGTERPLFPNIYWLPEKINIPKIAYGVSGYNSELALIQKNQAEITRYMNDFDVIGARDDFTLEMVRKHRTRTSGLVALVPDPAFLYAIKPTGIREKLTRLGVDFNRPILGLLLYGHDALSQAIQRHYHAQGYQILGLSMFNPWADLNLGHILTPFEWADVLGLCNFCITDRFHGTIFCLKNQTPFISLEKDSHLPPSQSKILNLLSNFDLNYCYMRPQSNGFRAVDVLRRCQEIQHAWEVDFKPGIQPKIEGIWDRHRAFLKETRPFLRG